MIFPEKQLILLFLSAGLPLAIVYSLYPETRIMISIVSVIVCIITICDALRCWHINDTVTIRLHDTLRMYRGLTAQSRFYLKSSSSVKGTILGTITDLYYINSDKPFSLEYDAQEEIISFSITPLQRGIIESLTLRIMTCSAMKLWCCIKNRYIPCNCTVFANNRKEIHLLNALQSGGFTGNHLNPFYGKGREVDRLRNYVPGDSMGDIHWKAMARHGFPITKEYRIERSQSLYIIIDASCFSKRTAGYQTISGNDSQTLPVPLIERSIITADILIMLANRQGDRAGLAAFDDKVKLFIPADTGISHLTRCRITLIELQTGKSPSDYREMFQFLAGNIHRRSMILILADLDDPYSSENFSLYSSILSNKHIVCAVCPVSPGTVPLYSREVGSTEEIYSALSGHLKWQSIKKLQANARKRGCDIIMATHDSLTVTAIGAYIDMKRKQLL
jgi:uncharacterized protein (DUF58 family)